MNDCIFLGRLVADPETRYAGETAITRFRMAVNRRFKRDGDPDADFINITAFGKNAETIGKYFVKGSRILLRSHVQTGSYVNKDGQKVHTTDFIVDEWEFIEARTEKGSEGRSEAQKHPKTEQPKDGELVPINDQLSEELPWD